MDTLEYYESPEVLWRIAGNWLTRGNIPQKAGHSAGHPLLWILRVNGIAEYTGKALRRKVGVAEDEWTVVVQISADAISAAVGTNREKRIQDSKTDSNPASKVRGNWRTAKVSQLLGAMGETHWKY